MAEKRMNPSQTGGGKSKGTSAKAQAKSATTGKVREINGLKVTTR